MDILLLRAEGAEKFSIYLLEKPTDLCNVMAGMVPEPYFGANWPPDFGGGGGKNILLPPKFQDGGARAPPARIVGGRRIVRRAPTGQDGAVR